jgi:prolyl-tRNA synthetase
MKYSRLIGKTIRQQSGNQTIEGYSLLLRGGYIHVLGQGLITYLPMGQKVMDKLKHLISSEMHELGGEEFLAPLVNPISIWHKSGRSGMKENPLVTFKDVQGHTLVLAPTHEEAAVELARSTVLSYRDLPLFIYQFQTKFRDEQRTRLGLVRAKEFIMKDAYSFHSSYADLNNFFPKVFNAYVRIFKKCNVPILPAESGVGIMGGSKAYEFLFPHEQGRDVVMVCPSCGYKANRSVAVGVKLSKPEALRGLSQVETDGNLDLVSLAEALNVPLSKLIKPRVYESEEGPVMAVVRGDYDVSLDKLAAVLGFSVSTPAKKETLKKYKLLPGYMSPAFPPEGVRVIVDELVVNTPNLVLGNNKGGTHYINANFGRDFELPPSADIAQLNQGDLCFDCGKELEAHNAIEMGNIFKLDDYYTKRMRFSFENAKGQKVFPQMGAYGLGLGRLITCIAEVNRDEQGLVWPLELAPYTYFVMGIGRSSRISGAVDELVQELGEDSVLVDDRIESIGVKFRDAALIGIPLRIVVGRRYLENDELELKDRKTGVKWFIPKERLKQELKIWREQHVPSI